MIPRGRGRAKLAKKWSNSQVDGDVDVDVLVGHHRPVWISSAQADATLPALCDHGRRQSRSRGAQRPRVSNAIIPASSLSSDLARERSSSRPNKDDAHRIRPDGSVACHTLVNWWVVALLNKLGDNWRDVACGAAGAGQYRWVCMTR